MPKAIICGTIGLDDVETPFGKVKNVLGGSAIYAGIAASFFTKVGLVSIAGEDLPKCNIELMINRNINMDGVEFKGTTFRWAGSYEFDMNEAKTLKTELNNLADFTAKLPEHYKENKYIFLANIDPVLQLKVLKQIKKPKLTIMDTMNFWINTKKDLLLEVIKKVDILLLNDSEARQLFSTVNLVKAANDALKLGPKYVIIKKGEHGALLFCDSSHFNAPGYPLEILRDPTGCGDSFAGGMTGYLAHTDDISEPNIRKAIIYGSVIASFNAEDFSLERMKKLTREEIEKRYNEFEKIRAF